MPPILTSKDNPKNKTPYGLSEHFKDRHTLRDSFSSEKSSKYALSNQSFAYSQCQRNLSGYALGRSFRVCWGPGNTLLFPSGNSSTVSQIHLKSILHADEDKTKKQHIVTLKAHFNNTIFEYSDAFNKENNSKITLGLYSNISKPAIPFARLNSHTGSRHLAQSTFLQEDLFSEFERLLWQLLPALYDTSLLPQSSLLDTSQALNLLFINQRKGLSDWLSKASQSKVYSSQKKASHPLDEIWTCLIERQISKACFIAIKNGYPRLATLLAQAGGDATFKEYLSQQVFSWVNNEIPDKEDPRLIKIYILLIGEIYPSFEYSTLIPNELQNIRNSLLDGTSWVQSLGVEIWYGSYYNSPISESLAKYDHASGSFSCVNKPFPWYTSSSTSLVNSSVCYDTVYHVIKLHADNNYPLELVLDPLGYSLEFDVRCSWHIASQLKMLLPSSSKLDEIFSELSFQLSYQLINLGLWEWSVLVLLHLEDPHVREITVLDVLNRYIELAPLDIYSSLLKTQTLITQQSRLFTDKDKFLLQLGVPETWIHRAKACLAYNNKAYGAQLQHLLLAGELSDALKVFLYRIAPSLVFQNGLYSLKEFLVQLSSFAIPGWQYPKGALLFKDYSDIITVFEASDFVDSSILLELRVKAESLLDTLHSMLPINSFQSSVSPYVFSVGPGFSHLDSLNGVYLALTEMKLTLTQWIGKISWLNFPKTRFSKDLVLANDIETVHLSDSSTLTSHHMS